MQQQKEKTKKRGTPTTQQRFLPFPPRYARYKNKPPLFVSYTLTKENLVQNEEPKKKPPAVGNDDWWLSAEDEIRAVDAECLNH